MNEQILSNIRELKRKLLPNDRLILFGSQARGDAQPDSDWDLLILLDKKNKSSFSENYDNYGYPFAEIGDKFGAYLSVKVYNKNDWEKRSFTPFYENVMNDGIEIK
ncbi:hypothetical protein FACS189451_01470 [Bacteroidia bacterium]|nr:hypothetical protein FACS189451_01470 [Bacteroidia bacterium]